jgi:hypothetical protein
MWITAERTNSRVAAWFLAMVLIGGWSLADVATAADAKNLATAERLVEEARQAELQGDTARQFALLRKAVRFAPDYDFARWQLGQLKVDDKWVTVENAQRTAAGNPKLAEYRQLRAKYGESLDGQIALARWCHRNHLDEEARFHWSSVLALQPNNDEALHALGMRIYGGRPMTPAQIASTKRRIRDVRKAAEKWEPQVAKWRRAISGRDAAACAAALNDIRSLRAADAIPALEAVTLGRDASDKHHAEECRQIALAVVEALQAMPGQAAMQSLVRHAVISPSADVRSAATAKLKGRPTHEFVPILLSALTMPIESSFNIVTNPDGCVHYYHSLYREGPDADSAFDLRMSAMQHNLGGRWTIGDVTTGREKIGPPTESEATLAGRKAAVVGRYQSRYASAVAATQAQVWKVNQAAEQLNIRILAVLRATTGMNLSDSPKDWWDWWRNENEYYVSDSMPVNRRYYSDTDSYYYGQPRYAVSSPSKPADSGRLYPVTAQQPYVPRAETLSEHFRRMQSRSCFAKGTPVWTKTGQQPIETLALGDLVLAQDVNTGELAYKPVIARTVRPPSPIVNLSLGGEQILATRGHPFWVAGVGWRTAKEIGDGAILHGITGAQPIAAVKEVEPAVAYNLVVADFNTYFVGASGVLVHDNTPRRPTRASVGALVAR